MTKLDLRKELKYLYSPSAKKVEAVKVPRFQFAMADGMIEKGEGPSSSPQFAEALEALYGITYTLKFMCKLRKDKPIDYPVMALEGLWWIKNGEFDIRKPDNWLFTVMILQPDFITQKMFKEALEQLRKKRGDSPPQLTNCAWRNLPKGLRCRPCTSGRTQLSRRPSSA